MAWWLYKEMLITPDLKELLTCGFRQILLDFELLEMLLSEFFQNIAYNEEDVGTVLKIWTLLLNVFFLLENAYAWKEWGQPFISFGSMKKYRFCTTWIITHMVFANKKVHRI